ncbi:MAG: hypothetical protein ABIH46_08110 [Chloroflexota bacterium]
MSKQYTLAELEKSLEAAKETRNEWLAAVLKLEHQIAELQCPLKVGDRFVRRGRRAGMWKVVQIIAYFGSWAVVACRYKKDGTLGSGLHRFLSRDIKEHG